MKIDVIVIGGGIVGVATALQLLQTHPALTVALLEKEDTVALHQSGHNSGVVHAGIYYAPGSLKAQFCKAGVAATIEFCRQHQLPLEPCGKLLVATNNNEVQRMNALYERSQQNGLTVEKLSQSALRELEPNINGEAALLVSATSIVNYSDITKTMAHKFCRRGGALHLSTTVTNIREERSGVTLSTNTGEYQAKFAVVCAGLMADRLAHMCGIETDFRIIPFRGQYYRLAAKHDQIVKHLIYPIPDPDLPFLGVHLTRMIGGYVTVGPNAVLSMGRETYDNALPPWRDILSTLSYAGFWKVAGTNLRSGVSEFWNSLSRKRYLQLCHKYCPELTIDDLLPHPPGIRAQAVMRDGSLVHDFLIRQSQRTLHVCNAPSPAATSSIPIARYLTELAGKAFSLQ